jgi:hypothetical protein
MPVVFPTLLVFAKFDDQHVRAVLPHLSATTTPYVCDFSVPFSASLITGDPPRVILRSQSGEQICFEDVQTIWWWRPAPFPVVSSLDSPTREFIMDQHHAFWNGLLGILPSEIRWYNHYQKETIASRKIFQLQIAQECGFSVPATLVTSDPSQARRFVSDHKNVVFKSLLNGEGLWRPTQLLNDELLSHLDSISICPIILQEFVAADLEYRITVIDEYVEAVVFDISKSRYPFDVRIDLRNRCSRTQMPDRLKHSLQNYLRLMGLRYGAFDLRQRKSGELVFLEANPSGLFLYLDLNAKTEIASAMGRALSTEKRESHDSQAVQDEIINYEVEQPLILYSPPARYLF